MSTGMYTRENPPPLNNSYCLNSALLGGTVVTATHSVARAAKSVRLSTKQGKTWLKDGDKQLLQLYR